MRTASHFIEAGPNRNHYLALHEKVSFECHLDEEKSLRIALRGTSQVLFARCIAVVDLKKIGLCCKRRRGIQERGQKNISAYGISQQRQARCLMLASPYLQTV